MIDNRYNTARTILVPWIGLLAFLAVLWICGIIGPSDFDFRWIFEILNLIP